MDEDPPSALSASPSLSVAATATVNSLRHSGQSHFSTMMQIQGHTVKVNGITYVFDKHQEYDPQKKPRQLPCRLLDTNKNSNPENPKQKSTTTLSRKISIVSVNSEDPSLQSDWTS